jgi:hypothetical protein
MLARLHHVKDASKLLEVGTLRGSQWTFFEERHHERNELRAPLHAETTLRSTTIVRAVLLDDDAAPEHLPAGGVRAPLVTETPG